MSIPNKTFMFILLAVSVVFISVGAVSAADSTHKVANVKSNTHINTTDETIQEMIDHAKPGSTISIVKGTYNENLIITKNITLKGAGASNTIINGRHKGSVITIKRKQTVKLIGLTLINGKAIDGDGIRNVGGTLIVENSTIKGNTANYGGGIDNTNYGTCTVTNSIITNNTAEYDGGGINSGKLTILNSKINGNTAHIGGGIYHSAGINSKVINSILEHNSAFAAGGICNQGSLTVKNSKITLNIARGNNGGGIYNSGTLNIENSTITRNTAEHHGGGIFTEGGTCTLTWSTIEHNSAYRGGGIYNTNKHIEHLINGVLSLHNSIITLNTAKNDGGGIFNNGVGEKDGKTQIKENHPDNVKGNTIN